MTMPAFSRRVLPGFRCMLLFAVVTAALALPVAAQTGADSAAAMVVSSQTLWLDALHRPMATRSELETLATRLEERARPSTGKGDPWARARAQLIRERLGRGDFRPGDRIYVYITAPALPTAVSDTLRVRAGDSITVPNVTSLSLQGLLRSEVQPVVAAGVSRLYKNASVRTEPLLRVAILGAVDKAGYFDVPSDILLTDVLMRAGGPAATADLNAITVRRDDQDLYSAPDIRTAIQQQFTVDQLDIRSGDTFVVPVKGGFGWSTVMQVVGAIGTLSFLFYGIFRRY